MKRIFASLLGLITLAVVFAFQFEIPVSPQTRGSRFTVRVYNLDELAIVYLNEREIGRMNSGSDATIDLGDKMWPGTNHLRLVVENRSDSYTFGFEVMKDGEVIHAFECGRVKQTGCGDSTKTGIVFDKSLVIYRDIYYNGGSNSMSMLGNLDANANLPSNAWLPASNFITNAPRNMELIGQCVGERCELYGECGAQSARESDHKYPPRRFWKPRSLRRLRPVAVWNFPHQRSLQEHRGQE